MKVKIFMATLVAALLMGVQGFASPCDSACVNPCDACNASVKGDLFAGLKNLFNGVRNNGCAPCEPVLANCTPCDEVFGANCTPCDEVCSLPKFSLGKRLQSLFASQSCNTGCFDDSNCFPCDVVDNNCAPCDIADNCFSAPKFSLRGLFKGLNRGCDSDCAPCDVVNGNCMPCDGLANCDPCGDVCNTNCGPRGHLFDLPRINLGRLFNGFRLGGCNDNGCNPCDEVAAAPCDKCTRF